MTVKKFGDKTNLWEETIECLHKYGLSFDDVLWVSVRGKKLSIDRFKALADFEYDAGFGSQEVQPSLRLHGKDWLMYRHEYDGAEGWRLFSTKEPIEESSITTLEYD